MTTIHQLSAAYAKAVAQNPQGVIHENITTAVEAVPLFNSAFHMFEALQWAEQALEHSIPKQSQYDEANKRHEAALLHVKAALNKAKGA